MEMMKLEEVKIKMLQELKGFYDDQESRQMVSWLIESFTGISRVQLLVSDDLLISAGVLDKLWEGLNQLKAHKPVQYVTGEAFFHGLKFRVTNDVLIPRPETEELVQWVIDDHQTKPGLRILDIGTGSGCIIITLGKKLSAPCLYGLDISSDALNIAHRNALRHELNVTLRRMDLFDRGQWDEWEAFDIMVSNPPYVAESEMRLMKSNVLDYEPQQALFVSDDDPLVFYREIAVFAMARLKSGGVLYVEINENFGHEVVALFKSEGYSQVLLRKDMSGRDRMVRAVI